MVASLTARSLLDQYEFTSLSYAADESTFDPPEWFTVTAVRLIGEHWHHLTTTTEHLAEPPARLIVTRIYVREKSHADSHRRIQQRATEMAMLIS
jgi:hypothetical protein